MHANRVRLCPSKLLWAQHRACIFCAYIDPVLEHNGCMIRRRSEDQEEGGVSSGSWQDMAALCGVGNDSGEAVVAGGDQPSWPRTQQKNDSNNWDSEKTKEGRESN